MTKYILKRFLHGLVSVVIVVAIVMVMIYSMLDRNLVFAKDPVYTRMANNAKENYMYRNWETYGYLDYVAYTDYLADLQRSGEIDEETFQAASSISRKAANDSEIVAKYAAQFREVYESRGYTVIRRDAVMAGGKKVASGGQQTFFAYKDIPLWQRTVKYFAGLFKVDNIYNVQEDIGERGLSFTWFDPVYGGNKFSPAIIGNGTTHKYLLYCDNSFPFIHQNLVSINLGKSSVVNQGIDVFDTMTMSQGTFKTSTVTYPSGLVEESADDLHSAIYAPNSLHSSLVYETRFVDDYTNTQTAKSGMSKMGYSFTIGLLSVLMAYLLGVPLGILMARRKDRLVDKLGTLYIVFIIAVPSLSYIFLFKALGGLVGLPTTFNLQAETKLMYVLPIVSLALPSIGNLMKWMRRYMIDQMNSDYVKFARSGGLTEGEIFRKHIMKNAIIPLVHGIPGSVLGCLVGAIITERVYVVPGTGNLLTTAIDAYDNSVIVGLTLFYAVLSIVAVILGDILMSIVDPRISFSSKAR